MGNGQEMLYSYDVNVTDSLCVAMGIPLAILLTRLVHLPSKQQVY